MINQLSTITLGISVITTGGRYGCFLLYIYRNSGWIDFYEWKSDPFPFIIIIHSFVIDTSHLVAKWRNCLAIYTSLQSENLSKAQTQSGYHLCTLDVLGECSLITLFQCVCIVATLLFVWAVSHAISLRPPIFPFICSTYKALLIVQFYSSDLIISHLTKRIFLQRY